MNDKDLLMIKLLTELLKALADQKSPTAKLAIRAAENYMGTGENSRRLNDLSK